MHRLQMTIVRGICCAILLLPAVNAIRAREGDKATSDDVDMAWGVKVPMRDGVILSATVYRPHGQKETLPLVFTFTPYIGDSYTDRAKYFAMHGYVYALVDVRGRGNQAGSSSHSRMKAAMDMMPQSGSPSNPTVTEKWRCGADPMRDLINGQS